MKAKPVYDVLAGYQNEHDVRHEAYLGYLEAAIGQPIAALSRRKDSSKIYRHEQQLVDG
jgi:hypothetical protein